MIPQIPIYLSENEIVELHDRVIGLMGGMPGIRDRVALESCVAQPQTVVFDTERFPALSDKAAAYCFFIVRSHPFLDGNKRTGFLAGLHFLLQNGATPNFDEDEMYETIVGVASGDLSLEDLASAFRKATSSH